MDDTTTLGEIHPDMERYLANDCYCPGEIYGIDGFFYMLYGIEDECRIIERSDDMTAVIAFTSWHGKPDDKPQAIMFWHDDGSGRIVGAQRVDATENNVGILRSIVLGGKPDGRKLDEYEDGKLARDVKKVLDISDAVMIS